MKIYFITGNKGKFSELHSLIPALHQKDIDLPEIQEIDPHKIIAAKLQEALKHVDGWCIVEDTSLYFDALHGLPGPLIKWFLKTVGTEGLAHLATLLKNPKATAKTVIGFAKNKRDIQFFEGEIAGTIVSPRGTHGFGWDAIFQPLNSQETFAEMGPTKKGRISMRKIAALKLIQQIGL